MADSKFYTNRYFKMRIDGREILTALTMGFPEVEASIMTVKMGGRPHPHVEPVDATWTPIDVTNALVKDQSLWDDFESRTPVSPESGGNISGALFTVDLIRTDANGVEKEGWRLFGACYSKYGESGGDTGNTDAATENFSLAYSYAKRLNLS